MIDFIFENPAKIIFGKDALSRLTEEILTCTKTILLVYGGGSIKKTGLYDDVMGKLSAAGITAYELAGIVPNPRLERVREGIRICREHNVGLVLAVGGGSAIDTAKGIANGVPYEGDVWDFYAKKATPIKALPIGTVLTIPAAGSEMSYSSVITNEDGMYKRGFNSLTNVPKFSILNPEYTYTLPSYQTACGCADILAHLMERYFTQVEHVELTDRMLEAGMKTILHNAPIAMREPENYDARAEIMWTSSIAHNTLLQTGRIGDWGSHGIEHELSAEYDIAHGAGLAIVFPAWMTYVYQENPERFVQFACRVFDVDFSAGEQEAMILEGIRRMEQFFISLGMPVRLSEAGIDDSKLRGMAKKAVPTAEDSLGMFLKMSAEDVYQILLLAR